MTEKTYFFAISIPRDEIIEYTTKLNSYISKLFEKQHACTLKPLEVREDNVIAKIIIKTSEEKIKIFADRFFQKNYEFTQRDNDEIEITQKEPNLTNTDQNQALKH
ncbi:MAG: hypothetical protein DHS20C13_01060 [Thermodesulfobacteriota bacterium]|nr:MAG: hypothetical protein DHS20C13_01060 [Thermodesulfobacteriota bacterium]